MILYTYQNLNDIFPTEEDQFGGQEIVSIPGGQLVLEKDHANNAYRVVRLLATDPEMFLESRYTPGQLVNI